MSVEESLFNDRTFFTLFGDAWKARKDPGMGPIRLKVLLDYADKARGAAPVQSASHAAPPDEITRPGDIVTDARLDAMSAQDAQRRLLKAALDQAAKTVPVGGGTVVHMPDDFDASAIGLYLQEVGGHWEMSPADNATLPSRAGGWDFNVIRQA